MIRNRLCGTARRVVCPSIITLIGISESIFSLLILREVFNPHVLNFPRWERRLSDVSHVVGYFFSLGQWETCLASGWLVTPTEQRDIAVMVAVKMASPLLQSICTVYLVELQVVESTICTTLQQCWHITLPLSQFFFFFSLDAALYSARASKSISGKPPHSSHNRYLNQQVIQTTLLL